MKRTTNRDNVTKQQPTSVQSFAGGILNKYKPKQGKGQFGGLSLSHKKNSLGEPSVVQQRVHVQVIAPKDTLKQPKAKKDEASNAKPIIERVIEREKVMIEKQTVVYRDVQRIIKEHRTVREIAVTQPAVIQQGQERMGHNKADTAATYAGSSGRAKSMTTTSNKTETVPFTQLGKIAEPPEVAAHERRPQAGTDFHKWLQARSNDSITIQSARRLDSLQKPLARERLKLKSSTLNYRERRQAPPLQLTNARSGRLRSLDIRQSAAEGGRSTRGVVNTEQAMKAATSVRAKQAQQAEAKTAERAKQAEQAEAKTAERAKQAQRAEANSAERAKQAEQAEAKTVERAKQAEQAEAKTAERVKQAQRAEANSAERAKQAEQAEAKTAERVKQAEQAEAKTAERVKQAQQAEAKTAERAKQKEQAEVDEVKSSASASAVKGKLSLKGKPVPAARLEHLSPKSGADEVGQASGPATKPTSAMPGIDSEAIRSASKAIAPEPRSERASGQLTLMTSRGEMSVTYNQLPGQLRLLKQHATWFEAKPQAIAAQLKPGLPIGQAIAAKRLVHREGDLKSVAGERAELKKGSAKESERRRPVHGANEQQITVMTSKQASTAKPTSGLPIGAGNIDSNVRQRRKTTKPTNSLTQLISARARRHSTEQFPSPSRAKGTVMKDGAALQGNVRLVLRHSLGRQTVPTGTYRQAEGNTLTSQGVQNTSSAQQTAANATNEAVQRRATAAGISGRKQAQQQAERIHQSPKASPSLAATIHRRLAGSQPAQASLPINAQRKYSAATEKKPQGNVTPGVSAAVAQRTSVQAGSYISSVLASPAAELVGRRSAQTMNDNEAHAASKQGQIGQTKSGSPALQPTTTGAIAAVRASTTHRLIRSIQQRTTPQTSRGITSANRAGHTSQRVGSKIVPLSLQAASKRSAEQPAGLKAGKPLHQAAQKHESTPASSPSPLRLRFAARPARSDAATSSLTKGAAASQGPYSAASAMPQLAHHQRKQAAQKEPERHVQVEAPKELDPDKLQKMIMKIPQLRPEAIADQVYKALERKMKLEQRRRGY
ncbi:cell envelope integrity protein TolA [Paenibacillus harenae]|uniref:cell envelope integrity protein TolA n=1 Tax=Paenibacillus harenae TaxID=306543 RepID=UPI00278D5E61|nr:hypothetical protein [Paenibacillus harenae]MDQ0061124.1 hypothetical protein [Paenibacillus harenae]